MATTFPFPPSPTVGQVITLTSGEQMQWNGYTWVDTSGGIIYPIAIAQGGTSATTAPAALTNLTIPNHNLLTVGRDASQNLEAVLSDQVNAAVSYYADSKASGYSQFTGRKNGKVRWNLALGDATAEGGSNVGSEFRLGRHGDDGVALASPLTIYRKTGNFEFRGGGASFFMNTAVPGTASHIFDGGSIVIRDPSLNSYYSYIGQVGANDVAFTRTTADWSAESIRMVPGRITLYAKGTVAGARNLTYWADYGLYIQSSQTTTAAASAAMLWDAGQSAHYLAVCVSSSQYKRNIAPLADGAIVQVMKLNPVTYQSTIEKDGDEVQPGFVAEDVDAAGLTEYVRYDPEGKPDWVKYDRICVLLTKAMQELSTRVQALEGATP